jgi:single-stranded DNA-binding protein
MALSLTFTGFVEEAKTFDWGSVVTVTHANRKKNEQGKWETVSRDYIDVSVDASSEFGWLLTAEKGTRVTITGNAKLATYEKKDGTSAVKIRLYPQAVEVTEMMAKADAPF